MCATCIHVGHMPKMIQIRNVPDELHRRLKARAAQAGMSLSEYLLNEMRKIAEQPTWDEFRARLATRSPVELSIEPAEIIREMRDRG
jgi:plasmid stability protein